MNRLRTLLSFLLLLGSGLSIAAEPDSHPEIYSFTQEYQNDKGESVVQTNTIYWVDPSRFADALEFADADLTQEGFSKDLSPAFAISAVDHPELFSSASSRFQPKTFVQLTPSDLAPSAKLDGRNPSSEPTDEAYAALEKEFNEYYTKDFKLRRITLIVSRFVVNGVVSGFGFIAGGIPWTHSVVLGSLTGTLSGTLQIFTRPLNDFLSTNKYGILLAQKMGFKISGQIEKSPFFSMLIKWGGLEVGFLTILKLATHALGDASIAASIPAETFVVFATAAKSLLSQGLWDTSVAKELSPKIKEAILKHDFIRAARLRFKTEISGFAGSMVWSVAAITSMMGAPIGDYVFGGLATVGGGNHVRLLLKDKSKKFAEAFKKLPFWCDRFLKSKKPL